MNEARPYKYRGMDYLLLTRQCMNAEVRIITGTRHDGNKPDLVFVHGLGGTWNVWGRQMSWLSDEYNVYSLDLPWSGREEVAFDSIDSLVEWFGKALETVPAGGMGRSIIAHSFGASITALHMAQCPSSVERAILCSPFWHSGSGKGLNWEDFQRFIDNYRYFIKASLLYSSERMIEDNVLAIMAEKALQNSRPHSLLRFFDFLFSIPEVDFRDIEAKVLLIVGEEDAAVNPACAKKLHQLMPGSKLVTYGDAGHFPMHECSARFRTDLLDYLEKKGHA